MAAYDITEISPKYHKAISDWQKRNFPELGTLEKNWAKYFGKQTPFRLISKVGKLKNPTISVGRYQGQPYFEAANDMVGNMFFSAQGIVKAQCSTELGSVQQHRMSIDGAITDEMKYGILRIMAEELRHAYQMFWVLEHDPTWKRMGMGDVADQMIQELLSMETGEHVLDAFNMEMQSFLDNVMFATVIDLVGKYQLDMQSVFAYGPMARSMGPMLVEEGFHLGHGRKCVRQVSLMAAEGTGDYSVQDIQLHVNKWLPRGLEMFGNELGGGTNVEFGFKDKTNIEAQDLYYAEATDFVRDWNCAMITKVYNKGLEYGDANAIVERIWETKDDVKGIKSDMIIHTPARNFFRKRGLQDYVFQPNDVHGTLLTRAGGMPVGCDEFVEYLHGVLPEPFFDDPEWHKFVAEMYAHRGETPPDAGSNGSSNGKNGNGQA